MVLERQLLQHSVRYRGQSWTEGHTHNFHPDHWSLRPMWKQTSHVTDHMGFFCNLDLVLQDEMQGVRGFACRPHWRVDARTLVWPLTGQIRRSNENACLLFHFKCVCSGCSRGFLGPAVKSWNNFWRNATCNPLTQAIRQAGQENGCSRRCCCLVHLTLSCCQQTAQAGEGRYSADLEEASREDLGWERVGSC